MREDGHNFHDDDDLEGHTMKHTCRGCGLKIEDSDRWISLPGTQGGGVTHPQCRGLVPQADEVGSHATTRPTREDQVTALLKQAQRQEMTPAETIASAHVYALLLIAESITARDRKST